MLSAVLLALGCSEFGGWSGRREGAAEGCAGRGD